MLRYSNEDGTTYRESTHGDEVYFGDPPSVAEHHEYAPGKILGFFKDPRYDDLQMVVKCCAFKHIRSSPISTYWKQEYTFENKPWIAVISVESIVRHCLMIPENDKMEGFHEIYGRDRWAGQFCDV